MGQAEVHFNSYFLFAMHFFFDLRISVVLLLIRSHACICTRIIGLFMKMHPIVSGETGAVKVYRFGFHTIDEKLFLVAVGKNDTTIISWQIKQMH